MSRCEVVEARKGRENPQARRGQVRPTGARESAWRRGCCCGEGCAAALSLWLKRMGDGRRSTLAGADGLAPGGVQCSAAIGRGRGRRPKNRRQGASVREWFGLATVAVRTQAGAAC